MKQVLALLLLAVPFITMAQQKTPSKKIVIIYENDAHSTMEGYPKLAGLKEKTLKETPNVLMVSGGDFSTDFMPGSKLGSRSKGAGIIKVMNKVGYDYVVPGNHDFDFSVENLLENLKNLKATSLCCNFQELANGKFPLPGYAVHDIGGIKIGFVGVGNAKTISRQLMKYFSDADGKMLYSFCEENISELVQQNVDKARAEGADYVVVLSHLGDKDNSTVTSLKLIAETTGIDVVLDAHAHSLIPEKQVANKDGKEILLTSTGLKFANIGLLTIGTDGKLSAQMVPVEGLEPLSSVQEYIDQVEKEYE